MTPAELQAKVIATRTRLLPREARLREVARLERIAPLPEWVRRANEDVLAR